MIPGQIALRAMGFETLPIVNIENACASASSAFYLACMHLKAAEADVALAVGVDKMNTPEKQKAFDVLAGAQDVHDGETTLRKSPRKTMFIRCITHWRSTGRPTPSRKCLLPGRSPGR